VLAKENQPRVIAASVLTGISTALNFVAPYLLGETINAYTENKNASIGGVELNPVVLTLMLIATQSLSQIVPNFRDQVLAPVAANSTRKLMNTITEHQLNKSLDYHSKTPLGDQVYLIQKGFTAAGTGTPLLTQITPTLVEVVMAVALLSSRYGVGIGAGVAGTAALYTGYSALTTKPVIESREVMLKMGNNAWEEYSRLR
jgi:ABC-type multidrug transport system fused ATPase/permease subunit